MKFNQTINRSSGISLAGGLIFLFSIGLFSCSSDSNLDPKPKIVFKSLTTEPDSSFLILGFTDGDGDIGLSQNDTAGEFRYNCFIDIYRQTNGQWVKQEFWIPYYYRVPVLKKTKKDKPLEGDIVIELLDFPPDLATPEIDTLKAVIFIKDRAQNKSNEVESDVFYRDL
jgi:hypothetical protein